MNAWWIGNEESGWVHVRAETRGRAKLLHPNYGPGDDDITTLRALRVPALDGDGPARMLDYIGRPCREGDPDWCDEWGAMPDIPAMAEAAKSLIGATE